MDFKNDMSNKLTFVTEDNEQIELFVEEQTVINGKTYLLASTDCDSEESDAYILKEISTGDDTEAVYGIIEDEEEMSAVAGIFTELLEDTKIVL